MIPEGLSNFVPARSEEEAIAQAIADLMTRGVIPNPDPLYLEDLGDGTFEVVLEPVFRARPVMSYQTIRASR